MTEIILKPQNSTEWLYTVNSDFVEYVADGNDFSNYSYPNAYDVQSVSGTTSEEAIEMALTANPPTGTWKGYYQSLTGTSDAPTISGQSRNDTGLGLDSYTGIDLCTTSIEISGSDCGIYQEVYGLTAGADYSFSVDYRTDGNVPNSKLRLYVYDSSSGSLTIVNSEDFIGLTSIGSAEMSFTATGSDLILVVNFMSQVEECLTLTRVGLTETWDTVSFSLSDFTDGSVSLDLFEESIPLTLSVSEFTNAVDNVQSYSKDFVLPSTKRNDRVFSHIYNLDSSVEGDYTAFNPYVKTIAIVKEDNVEIFTGELTLSSISKGSAGIVYNVHLQSIITGMASVLDGRTFDSLNLSELKHDFTSVNVKNSWTGQLVLQQDLESDSPAKDQDALNKTSVIKYPFVNWVGSILDNGLNGDLELTRLEDVYRPWISAKYLLDKIFKSSGFGYDSAFLNSPDFTNLYMDFNHGGENGASAGSDSDGNIAAEWNAGSTYFISQSYTRIKMSNAIGGPSHNVPLADALFDYASGVIQPLVDNTSMRIQTQIMLYNETNIFKNIDVRLVKESFSGVKTTLASETIKILGSPLSDPHGTFAVSINTTLALGDKVYVEAKTHTGTANVVRQGIAADNDSTFIKIHNYGSDAVDFETILSESRGDIGQWEFIKSLMNMFNLLVMPTENPNRFNIEPYESVFGNVGYQYILPESETQVVVSPLVQSGVTLTQTGNSMTFVCDGTQTATWHGAYKNYYGFIEGETYILKYRVSSYSLDNFVNVNLYNNSFGVDHSSSGIEEASLSFVFTNDTIDGDKMIFQVRTHQSTGTVVLEDIELIGKFANNVTKKDWTSKVDEDTFTIQMQDLDKQVDFSFIKDEEDYAAKVYSEATSNPDGTSYSYGDLKYVADNYTALTSQENVSIDLFSSTIIKPLNDYSAVSDLIVPCIYQKEEENVFSVYNNSPRLLYNNGVKTFSGTYTSPYQNGQDGFSNENEYLQFSHFSEFDNITASSSPDSLDYNFKNCPSIVTNATVKGLFSEFWATYYDEKYHPDTRIYNIQALLTPNDIFNFEYTDIIRIKTQEFRVNSIQYNPKGMSKINLIKLP